MPRHEALHVDGASFTPARAGWVTGTAGTFRRLLVAVTSDGGRTWHVVHAPPIRGSRYLGADGAEAVHAVSRRVAYLFGATLWMTVDGGQHWVQARLPRVRQLIRVGREMYAVSDGSRGSLTPIVWRSTVGSRRWDPVTAPTRSSAQVAGGAGELVLLDPGRVTSGHGRIGTLWVSRDHGSTWNRRAVPCRPRRDGAATSVAVAAGSLAVWYLDCFDGEQAQQAIQGVKHRLFVTRDGGTTWQRVGSPSDTGVPVQLVAQSPGRVILAVTNGGEEILRQSSDYGATWRTALDVGAGGFAGPHQLEITGRSASVVCVSRDVGQLYRSRPPFSHWHREPVMVRLRR